MEISAAELKHYRIFETRISYLTLVLGAAASLPVGYLRGLQWGLGIFTGSILAWLSFRWLKQGLDALTEAAKAQADQKKVKVPVLIYFKALFRYGLIGLAVYVIFEYLHVPVLSMVLGLCALGAATLVVSVHEIVHPQEQ